MKNDTGAYSTSIDYETAQKLGYEEVLNFFNSLEFIKKGLTQSEAIKTRRKWNALAKEHPLVQRLIVIRSGNGVSIRPVVSIKLEMSGVVLETRATIEDREGLKYPVIIGRRDLRRFLIDTSKR